MSIKLFSVIVPKDITSAYLARLEEIKIIPKGADKTYREHCLAYGLFGKKPSPYRVIDVGSVYSFLKYSRQPLKIQPNFKKIAQIEELQTFDKPGQFTFKVITVPIIRKRRNGKRYEIDPFVLEQEKSREACYSSWLKKYFAPGELIKVSLVYHNRRKVSRNQHSPKSLQNIFITEAEFTGELQLTKKRLEKLLLSGVGRHKTFGYGMLLLAEKVPKND